MFASKPICFAVCLSCLSAAQAVTLHVDLDSSLELKAGPHSVSTVERSRYFRTYHIPGMYSPERVAELKSLGISPGRGTGPYFGSSGGDKNRAAWSASEQEQFEKYAEMFRTAAERYPDTPFAMAGGKYPPPDRFVESGADADVDATMTVKHRKGVLPKDFDECIDLIDGWLAVVRDTEGSQLPEWFSPLNEPDAAWKSSPNPPQDHADFARKMAIRLKEKYPEVKLSGPCTAWGHPNGDWSRWTTSGWERRFIDTVGDVAGAYDFHLYSKEYWAYSSDVRGYSAANKQESPNLYETLKNGNRFVWDFGKADAYLDLVYAYHQQVWGTPSLPVIISEFGRQGITPQLGPWSNDYLYYLYGTTVTRFWMAFMDRPEIELTVPFILPESDSGYGPQRGQAMYTRPGAPGDMSLVRTPLFGFYEFFQGLEGIRVPTEWDGVSPERAPTLFAVAARQGDELWVLLHTAMVQPLNLTLDLTGKTSVKEARIARMRWEGRTPDVYTNASGGHWRIDRDAAETCDLSNLVLGAEETALVKIRLSSDQFTKKTVSERFYADQTLQSVAQAPAEFSVMIPSGLDCSNAELVATLTAPVGFSDSDRLVAEVNGQPCDAAIGFTHGMENLLAPLTFKLPEGTVSPGKNTVSMKLRSETQTAWIASVRIDIMQTETVKQPGFWENVRNTVRKWMN